MAAYQIAQISTEAAQKIQELEQELDVCALALEPGLELAELSAGELEKVKELEAELDVRLVVYQEC